MSVRCAAHDPHVAVGLVGLQAADGCLIHVQHRGGKQVVVHAFPDWLHGIRAAAHPVAQHPFAEVEDALPLKLSYLAVKRQFEHVLVVEHPGDDAVANAAAGQDRGRGSSADGRLLLLAPALAFSNKGGAMVDVQSQMCGYDFHSSGDALRRLGQTFVGGRVGFHLVGDKRSSISRV